MRQLAHWIGFIALLLPLLWLGFEHVHYLHFLLYIAAMAGITVVILGIFQLAERVAPTIRDNDNGG